MRLENWYITSDPDAYLPPEAQTIYLCGEVYDHPRWEPGHMIRTSPIVKVEGKFVTTHHGSVYELGKPEDGYMEYCKVNKLHIPTPEEPIKVKSRDRNSTGSIGNPQETT